MRQSYFPFVNEGKLIETHWPETADGCQFQTGQAWQNNFNNFDSICYFIYSDAGF